MNRNRLIASLKQIKALVEESLDEVGQTADGPREKPSANAKTSKSRKTLPFPILKLRDEGLFGQPRTAKEVHARLQSNYACDLNRVAVALLRLQKRKNLRKTSKGIGAKKQVAYVW